MHDQHGMSMRDLEEVKIWFWKDLDESIRDYLIAKTI